MTFLSVMYSLKSLHDLHPPHRLITCNPSPKIQLLYDPGSHIYVILCRRIRCPLIFQLRVVNVSFPDRRDVVAIPTAIVRPRQPLKHMKPESNKYTSKGIRMMFPDLSQRSVSYLWCTAGGPPSSMSVMPELYTSRPSPSRCHP